MSTNPVPLPRSGWRWFPFVVGLGLFITVVVNGALAYFASHSFPGDAAAKPYEVGMAYNSVLAEAEREAAVGWRLDVTIEGRRVMARLVDRAGAPLEGITLTASLIRPLGATTVTPLSFAALGDGLFQAKETVPLAGQWDVKLVARDTKGETLGATRRVIAR